VAVSGNYDRDVVDEMKLELKRYIVKVRQAIPKVRVDDDMARKAGEYIAELREYSPMSDILSIRTVKNGFLTALKAVARMNLRETPNNSDYNYVKEIFEKTYAPEGMR